MSGTSARENLQDVQNYVNDLIQKKRSADGEWSNWTPIIIDVGAGSGTYADALFDTGAILEAVESWPPTVAALLADPRYRYVYEGTIQECGGRGLYQGATVGIFGDVLEHLTIHDAHVVFAEARRWLDHIIVSVPNSPYPQGAIDGNHLEEHLILDPVKELIPFLPEYQERWDYPVTSTFIWKR